MPTHTYSRRIGGIILLVILLLQPLMPLANAAPALAEEESEGDYTITIRPLEWPGATWGPPIYTIDWKNPSTNNIWVPATLPYFNIVPPFTIVNEAVVGENGVTTGSGTIDDPYIIEGWTILPELYRGPRVSTGTALILNLTSPLIIRNVSLMGGGKIVVFNSSNVTFDSVSGDLWVVEAEESNITIKNSTLSGLRIIAYGERNITIRLLSSNVSYLVLYMFYSRHDNITLSIIIEDSYMENIDVSKYAENAIINFSIINTTVTYDVDFSNEDGGNATRSVFFISDSYIGGDLTVSDSNLIIRDSSIVGDLEISKYWGSTIYIETVNLENVYVRGEISISEANNVILQNIYSESGYTAAIFLDNVRNALVDRARIDIGYGDVGVKAYNVENLYVKDIIIADTSSYGIRAIVSAENSGDIYIKNVTLEDPGQGYYWPPIQVKNISSLTIEGYNGSRTQYDPFLYACNVAGSVRIVDVHYNTNSEILDFRSGEDCYQRALPSIEIYNSSFNGLPANTYTTAPPNVTHSILVLKNVSNSSLKVNVSYILTIVHSDDVNISVEGTPEYAIIQDSREVNITGRLSSGWEISYFHVANVTETVIYNVSVDMLKIIGNSAYIRLVNSQVNGIEVYNSSNITFSNNILSRIVITDSENITIEDIQDAITIIAISTEGLSVKNADIDDAASDFYLYTRFTRDIRLVNLSLNTYSSISITGDYDAISTIENVTIGGKEVSIVTGSTVNESILETSGALLLVNSTLIVDDYIASPSYTSIMAWNSTIIMTNSSFLHYSSLTLNDGSTLILNRTVYKSRLWLLSHNASIIATNSTLGLYYSPYVLLNKTRLVLISSQLIDSGPYDDRETVRIVGPSYINSTNSLMDNIEFYWTQTPSTTPGMIIIDGSNITSREISTDRIWLTAYHPVNLYVTSSNITGYAKFHETSNASIRSTFFATAYLEYYANTTLDVENASGSLTLKGYDDASITVTITDSSLDRLVINERYIPRLSINLTNNTFDELTIISSEPYYGEGAKELNIIDTVVRDGDIQISYNYPSVVNIADSSFSGTEVDITYYIATPNTIGPLITIVNNTFANMTWSDAVTIKIPYSKGPEHTILIAGNVFTNMRKYGLVIRGGNALITNNTFRDSAYGMEVFYGQNYEITNNVFENISNYYIVSPISPYLRESPLINATDNIFDGSQAIIIKDTENVVVSDRHAPFIVVYNSTNVTLTNISTDKVIPGAIIHKTSSVIMDRVNITATSPLIVSLAWARSEFGMLKIISSRNVTITNSIVDLGPMTNSSTIEAADTVIVRNSSATKLSNVTIVNYNLYPDDEALLIDESQDIQIANIYQSNGTIMVVESNITILGRVHNVNVFISNCTITGANVSQLEFDTLFMDYMLNPTRIIILNSTINNVTLGARYVGFMEARIIDTNITGPLEIRNVKEVLFDNVNSTNWAEITLNYLGNLRILNSNISTMTIDYTINASITDTLYRGDALGRHALILKGVHSTSITDSIFTPVDTPINFAYSYIFEYGNIIVENTSINGKPVIIVANQTGTTLSGEYGEVVIYNTSNVTIHGTVHHKSWIILSSNTAYMAHTPQLVINGSGITIRDINITRLSAEYGLNIYIDNITTTELGQEYFKIVSFKDYPVTINNSLINIEAGATNAINIQSHNISIINTLITSPTINPPSSSGGILRVSNGSLLLKDTTISNTAAGVSIELASNCSLVVDNSTIAVYSLPINATGTFNSKIIIRNSNIIVNNTNYEGMYLTATHISLENTTIAGEGRYSLIQVIDAEETNVKNVSISFQSNNEYVSVASFSYTNRLMLEESSIWTNNGSAVSIGASSVIITESSFTTQNGISMKLFYTSGVIAYNNITSTNGTAIYIYNYGAIPTLLLYMNYVNSSDPVDVVAPGDVWFNTSTTYYIYNGTLYQGMIGNYWTVYNGSDSDNDGIGDTPLYLDQAWGGVEYYDYHPLIQPPWNYIIAEPIEAQPAVSNLTVLVNETARHVFNITNMGSKRHTYTITATSGTLNTTSLTLGPGETGWFVLEYTPSSEGTHVINITIIEDGITAFNWTLQAVTNAIPRISSFYISSIQPGTSQTVYVGEEAIFNVTITYNGTINDTIDAVVDKGTVTPAHAPVSPGANTTFTISYTPSIPGTHNITLTLISQYNESVNTTLTLTVQAEPPPVNFTVQPEVSNITVITGEDAVHVFNITNTGNWTDTYNITTTLGTLNTSTITLEPGETGYFQLTFESETPGTFTANITITSNAYPLLRKNVQAVTIVRLPVRNVSVINVKPGYNQTIDWNETAIFNITLRNNGEVVENLTATTNYGDVEPSTLTINPGEERTITLTFDPPAPGNYTITVSITSNDYVINITLQLNVTVTPPERGVIVTGIEPGGNQTVIVGDTAVFTVTLENIGEVQENLTLEVDLGEVSPSSIEIGPGEQANATVTYTPYEPGNYTITLHVYSPDYVVNITVELHVTARLPVRNITITKVYPATNQTIFIDEEAVFNITIMNQGEVEENITITASQGTIIPTWIILTPGEAINATLIFEPPAPGNYTITVEAQTTDGEAGDSVDLHVEVRPIHVELLIEPGYQEAVILDNETAVYHYNITNRGDRTDNVTITVDYGNITPNTISLPPGETAIVTLTVAGEPGTVISTITVISGIDPNYTVTAIANTTILARYNYTVAIAEDEIISEDQVNTTIRITIINTGALEDTYTVTADHAIQQVNTTILPGGNETITLTLYYHEPGIYEETINVTSTGSGETTQLTITAMIYEAIYSDNRTAPGAITLFIPDTNTTITLTLVGAGGVTVYVIPPSMPPAPPGTHLYMIQDVVLTSPSNTSEPITIIIGYNESYLASLGISEATLTPLLYNASTGEWVEFANYTIDGEHNTIAIYASIKELSGTPIVVLGGPPPTVVGGRLGLATSQAPVPSMIIEVIALALIVIRIVGGRIKR